MLPVAHGSCIGWIAQTVLFGYRTEVTFPPAVCCSARSPAVSQAKSRKSVVKEEDEDLTKDMDDPTPAPNIQEVNIPKNCECDVAVWDHVHCSEPCNIKLSNERKPFIPDFSASVPIIINYYVPSSNPTELNASNVICSY